MADSSSDEPFPGVALYTEEDNLLELAKQEVEERMGSESEEEMEEEEMQQTPSQGVVEFSSSPLASYFDCFSASRKWRIERTVLYMSNILSAWGDRMWEFAAPIILTTIFSKSLMPAAMFSFVIQLSQFLFGAQIGQWVDDSSRKLVVVVSLLVQNLCVIICSMLLYFIIPFAQDTAPWGDLKFLGLFGGLLLFGGISALASMMEKIAVGRDWIVVLSADDPNTLSEANAVLVRISLVCKVASPMAISFVLSFASLYVVIFFVCLWNIISLVPELGGLLWILNRVPELKKTLKPKAQELPCLSLFKGWKDYITSKQIFLASFAYVLLYFTALSPGSLMSAYLLTRGVKEIYIAIFTGASALIGLVSTFGTPPLIKRSGIEFTGLISIWFQHVCLIVGVAFFFLLDLQERDIIPSTVPSQVSIAVFLLMLVLSRIGLWSFDLAERQIMQEYVAEEKRGIINSVEFSLTNVFSLLSYGVAIVAHDPDQFGWLVGASFSAVTIAALLYSLWTVVKRKATANINNTLESISVETLDGDEDGVEGGEGIKLKMMGGKGKEGKGSRKVKKKDKEVGSDPDDITLENLLADSYSSSD